MNCQRAQSLAEAFLDGELSAQDTLDLQAHADACCECREHLSVSRAIRNSSRELSARESTLRPAFEGRLKAALAEAAREEQAALQPALVPPLAPPVPAAPVVLADRFRQASPWLQRTAMAAAAAAAFWFGMRPDGSPVTRHESESAPVQADVLGGAGSTVASAEELLDRLIDFHSAPPTTLLKEPQRLVQGLERDVGVRMPAPQQLIDLGGRWEGGNLVQVQRGQPAAYLRYGTDDGHRVTVYVYNASRIPLHTSLRYRVPPSNRAAAQPVYVGHRRGYSIAASNRYGVGYAVATDLDDERSAELVHRISSTSVPQ